MYGQIFSDFSKPSPILGKNVLEIFEELNNPRVILFDIYDTLLASSVGDLEAQTELKSAPDSFVKTSVKFGLSSSIGERWHELFFKKIAEEHSRCSRLGIGRGEVVIEKIWQDILSETVEEKKASRLSVKEIALYRELIANPVRPFHGIVELWRFLKETSISIGIVSNAQFYTLPILSWVLNLDLSCYLHYDFVILSYKLGFAKPDPHFFRYVETKILRAGLKPQDVWIVGNDLENDIKASKPFGFVPIFFVGNVEVGRVDDIAAAVVGSYAMLRKLIEIAG